MPRRTRLVIYQAPYQQESLFHSAWFADLIQHHFDIEPWRPDQTYHKNTVFVVGCNHWIKPEVQDHFYHDRVIVDALWESNTSKWGKLLDTLQDHQIIFYGNRCNTQDHRAHFVPSWFWYNESLWYRQRGWHRYRPSATRSHLFLMPIGHYRPWRATVVERLSPWLTQSYWSMVSRGEFLPGTRSGKRMDHRHHEPDWFDHTHFSVVCESARTWEAAVTFLTEKTYKAIAGWHPFMLIGAPGLLAMLREQGFETFDNCFDESYDQVAELDLKLDIVIDNIKRYRYGSVDPETQRRILHNRMLFYNTRRVQQGLIQDVLDPISHYINSESTG